MYFAPPNLKTWLRACHEGSINSVIYFCQNNCNLRAYKLFNKLVYLQDIAV